MLVTLGRHGVDFIVVGGVAAVVHGAPITTEDLDVVYAVTPENVERLAAALGEMGAIYRDPAGRRIAPDAGRLSAFRLSLLDTRLGRLDVLREIGRGQRYEDLLPQSEQIELDATKVWVLGLATVIESKEHAGRPKDHMALPFLREVLDRIRAEKKS